MKSLKSLKYIKHSISISLLTLFLCLVSIQRPADGTAMSIVHAAEVGMTQTAETENSDENVFVLYQEYSNRLESIEYTSDIYDYGFEIVENQIFPIELEGYGEVSLIPAFEEEYKRLALFFADEDGKIVYKTDQLETNNQILGQMKQPEGWIHVVC